MERVSTDGFVERRRHPRLRTTTDHAMVVLADGSLVGELVDISLGGFAFYYRDLPSHWNKRSESGLLIGADDLWVQDMPIKTIQDFVVKVPVFKERPVLRRRCMAFGTLTDCQEELLRQYIMLNTHDHERYALDN